MKWMNLVFSIVLPAQGALLGCATRAPTKFELDRRAGLMPESEASQKALESPLLTALATVKKIPHSPHRVGPRIEKIWVYDQELGSSAWMQGTFVFLEVEPGRWATEEPGEVAP